MGRLTKDPELRETAGGKKVSNFTVAVDRDKGEGADFFEVVAWESLGEFVNRNFFKGKMMVVLGTMQSRKWEDREGNKRLTWEINAKNVYFADDKRREDGWAQMDGGQVQYTAGRGPFDDAMSESDGTDAFHYGRMPF